MSSTALRDLYQELILDHHARPRNFRVLEGATGRADGVNPLCGDRMTLWISEVNGVIADASFLGSGCAISRASASMMTERIRGRPRGEALALFEDLTRLLVGPASEDDTLRRERLGKLSVLEGVRAYPSRVKCATLAWHALAAALSGDRVTSTEDLGPAEPRR